MVNMLVDTGSATSLISRSVLSKLKALNLIIRPTDAKLSTTSGKQMNVSGEVDVCLEMAGIVYPRTLVIADMGHIQGILGLDFLEDNNVNFDVASGILNILGSHVTLHRESLHDSLVVYLREDVIIPPSTELCISGVLDRSDGNVDNLNGSWIVEAYDSMLENTGLIFGRSVVDVTKVDIPVLVSNSTQEGIQLRRGMGIGVIQPVSQVN